MKVKMWNSVSPFTTNNKQYMVLSIIDSIIQNFSLKTIQVYNYGGVIKQTHV